MRGQHYSPKPTPAEAEADTVHSNWNKDYHCSNNLPPPECQLIAMIGKNKEGIPDKIMNDLNYCLRNLYLLLSVVGKIRFLKSAKIMIVFWKTDRHLYGLRMFERT